MGKTAKRLTILLPPSKGKTGDDTAHGASFQDTLNDGHPLATYRREVAQALCDNHRQLEPAAQLRLYGVGENKRAAVAQLTDRLLDAPTKPARERYHGVVYTNAGLETRENDHKNVDVLIVSALLGIVDLDTPVPNYRIEFGARIPPVGVLSRYWGEVAAPYLNERLSGQTVLNLLPKEHRGILAGVDTAARLIDVSFLNLSGGRANTARIKVAKGQLTQALRQMGPVSLDTLAKANPLAPVWTLTASNDALTAVCQV